MSESGVMLGGVDTGTTEPEGRPLLSSSTRALAANPRNGTRPARATLIQCPQLYPDILELILHEHRSDAYTLAQTALSSHTLLHPSRKLLYRSISLDDRENPYAHEQQRRLRSTLASDESNLCGYVREVRVSVSDDDPHLARILGRLTRVERVHVVGDGGGGLGGPLAEAEVGQGYLMPPDNARVREAPSTDLSPNDHHTHRDRCGRGVGSTGKALQRVLSLPSLQKVILENISTASEEIYISCLNQAKHLEVLSASRHSSRKEDYGNAVPSLLRSSSQLASPAGRHSRTRTRRNYLNTTAVQVRLESLILSRDTSIRRFLVSCQGFQCFSRGDFEEEEEESGLIDLSESPVARLKEAHIYVWDPDEGDAAWQIVHGAQSMLEYLTIRHLHPHPAELLIPSTSTSSSVFVPPPISFQNLHTLIIGTPTFASMIEDPFRGLIQLFNPPLHSYQSLSSSPQLQSHATRFPALRTLKVVVDLWALESSYTSWRDVCAYRGWGELDEAIGRAFTPYCSGVTVPTPQTAICLRGSSDKNPPRTSLPRVFLELQCSQRYKHFSSDGQVTELGGPTSLVDLVRHEFYNLRTLWDSRFSIA